jgi:hypothetical protein
MSKNVLVLTALLVLLFTSIPLAQSYELDWMNVHIDVRETEEYTLDWSDTETSVSLNVQQTVKEQIDEPDTLLSPSKAPRLPQQKSAPSSSLYTPEAHLNLVASQWYDYDEQIYRVVDRVEVTLYPQAGGIKYRTFENLGAVRDYDVFLKNLSPGDRYEAFIVWDDGSNRTIEGTVRGQGWRSVFVDQPNPLGYKVWPTVW